MNQQQIKVEYLDHMGSDLTVVNAARGSFGKESQWARVFVNGSGRVNQNMGVLKPADASLIRYLATGYRTSEWDEFLSQVSSAANAFQMVGDAKGLTDLLHAYKRRAQHWAPFAHPHLQIRMSLPIFLARQFVKHCVTGDTEVTFVKRVKGESNGTRKATIKDLHTMWTGAANKYQGGEKGKRNVRMGHLRVFDEQARTFTTSHITDVLYQGVKPVFRVVAASGQSIRATGEHEVMTQRGWVPVSGLNLKDSLVTENGEGMLIDPAPVRWNDWQDKKARRAVVKEQCAVCGSVEDLEADHIVPVLSGGTHEQVNMQCLCATCHIEKSNRERADTKTKNQYSPRLTAVVSITPDGEEDVYDLTVSGIHNFMANGLVVHNCVGSVWSEESRRYISDEPGVWFPDEWHTRPEDIKQGSEGPITHMTWNDGGDVEREEIDPIVRELTAQQLHAYMQMVEGGVAPEEARIVLPLNTMTTVTWTGSLLFWSRVCNQRVDSHAQLAAQELGKLIADIVRPLYPVSWAALTGK